MIKSLIFCGQELASREVLDFAVNNRMGLDIEIVKTDGTKASYNNCNRIIWDPETAALILESNIFDETETLSLTWINEVKISFATFLSEDFCFIQEQGQGLEPALAIKSKVSSLDAEEAQY